MGKFRTTFRKALKAVRAFFVNNSIELFPVKDALKNYKREQVKYDLKAALSVALLALPQGMAYAAIAGLPIYYGIIASAVAATVAPLFSSSRHTILGPTNATAFMVFSFFAVADPEIHDSILIYMPLLVFMVGFISVVGALLKVADLLQYVSRSVLVGYITGAAILIMNGQLKHVFGVADRINAKTFFSSLSELLGNFQHFEFTPMLIGVGTLSLFFFLKRKLPALPNFAICLTVATLVSWILSMSITDYSVARFTELKLQNFSPSVPNFNLEHISFLFGLAFAIAFLASLENSVMGKSLGSKTGERPDVNQDMFSVGMANLGCSFLAAMPCSGSLTRSALNYESGAKSRFSSIFAGLFCLAGFFILASLPIVENIPKAALAALVIGIAISLINWGNIRICLYSTTDDAVVIITTFAATLLTRLDTAIFIGVALSITLFLRKASRPHLVEYEMNEEGDFRELGEKRKRPNPAISIVHVEGDLFFGAADLFRTQVQRTAADPNLKVVILRMKNARHLDATSVMALDDLINHMRKQGCHVIISGATRNVYKVLKQSGVLETILEGCNRMEGETNLFFSSPSNPNLSTRDALLRAQVLLGTKKADIKIFYDPSHQKK